MAAYLFAQVEVVEPKAYDEYLRLVPALIAAHRGRYLVRGGASEVLEGDSRAGRLVIVEFPDMTGLRAFYHSEAYQPLLAIRKRTTRSTLLAVGGV
jgi:uncharacterized protein (DUF1330 family)